MKELSRELRPEDIDSLSISAYMRSKGFELRCVFCGSPRISLNEVTTSVGFRVDTALGTHSNLYLIKSDYSADAQLAPIALSCENCGHIMLFDIEIIMNWFRENPACIMGEPGDD